MWMVHADHLRSERVSLGLSKVISSNYDFTDECDDVIRRICLISVRQKRLTKW